MDRLKEIIHKCIGLCFHAYRKKKDILWTEETMTSYTEHSNEYHECQICNKRK